MVIIIGNGTGDPSSNLKQSCVSLCTNALGQDMYLFVLSLTLD